VDELGIQNRVEFLGAVPFDEISALYHRAAVTVNLCPTGGADKAVLESMACGVPAVVHNRTFLPLLADDASLLWCEELSPRCTAQRIKDVLALPADERAALGNRLAHRVRADYDLGALIGRLVAVFEETIAEHRGGSR